MESGGSAGASQRCHKANECMLGLREEAREPGGDQCKHMETQGEHASSTQQSQTRNHPPVSRPLGHHVALFDIEFTSLCACRLSCRLLMWTVMACIHEILLFQASCMFRKFRLVLSNSEVPCQGMLTGVSHTAKRPKEASPVPPSIRPSSCMSTHHELSCHPSFMILFFEWRPGKPASRLISPDDRRGPDLEFHFFSTLISWKEPSPTSDSMQRKI